VCTEERHFRLHIADYRSWSKGGNLLASGSDDTYLNIWDYNPSNLAKPFTLNTSVSTGHHANIFSVKFMPHSGDRTVITCAGDSQVRVFDLEYGGATQDATRDSSFATNTRSRRFNNFFRHARWLNDGNTNARVYRSHSDRVKRVVTESSPHLFLTCSEDGEVRQWDLRQPSSAYPSPRGSRGYEARRGDDSEVGNLPPPLISYKKYALDLNSISCSGSQPQYIALGGAHLHCFLHDRRMIGRDLATERGQAAGITPQAGTSEDEAMSEATRCVRRFAPNEKRKMSNHDHGHITACKVSDANPNELIASWSGDHIYSFDIIKSPDARQAEAEKQQIVEASRLRHQNDRKRKRNKGAASSSSLADAAKPRRRLRRVADDQEEVGHTALLVRYENVQTQEIPVGSNDQDSDHPVPRVHDSLLTEAQQLSERVARSLVKLRKTMFDFSETMRADAADMEGRLELTHHTATFTSVLGQCSILLPQMDEIIRGWSYPVNPSDDDVTLQNTLRRNRQASWRFVQASGCLARILGGKLQTLSPADDPRLTMFDQIRPAAREGSAITPESRFCYDFLKAILLWIDGGSAAVLAGFIRPPDQSRDSPRYPLSADDGIDVLPEKLRAYLSDLASDDKSIVDIDANRFERDETRVVFQSQKQAVIAFTRALAGFRLASSTSSTNTDQSSSSASNGESALQVLDKGAAARFWCVKVGRSLLMEAARGVIFDFVHRAFGGLRLHVLANESGAERSQEDVDLDEEGEVVEAIDLIITHPATDPPIDDTQEPPEASGSTAGSLRTVRETTEGSRSVDVGMTTPPTAYVEDAGEDEVEAHQTDDDADEDENDNDGSDESHSDDESDDDDSSSHPIFRRHVEYGRSRERATVNLHVPYSSHTRVYRGHCNTRTVKDVNYYGLNDEYVVSGSDDGHFFIWDRKTTLVVNILEGDGEVVNVVQGHPYEPMIACSGIDSTVKIFGVGARERANAEQGRDVANPGGSAHSSLRLGGRRARMVRLQQDEEGDGEGGGEGGGEDGDDKDETRTRAGLSSRKAMHRSYDIIAQNDAERRRGLGDAFVTVSVDELFARPWLMAGLQLV
jgi:DDB1- and CUL4-associated factor 6